jgi:hypothetical protein
MESRKRLHSLEWIVAVILLTIPGQDASGASGSTGAVGGVAPSSGTGGTPAAGPPQSSPIPAPANPNDAGATKRDGCISGAITNNSGRSTGAAPIIGTQRGQGAATNDTSNSITGTGSNRSAGSNPVAIEVNGSNQATSSNAMTGQRGC